MEVVKETSESGTYEVQGQSFKLLPNDLSLLNKAAPMIARLRKLIYEYAKDIDMSAVAEYKERISELSATIQEIDTAIAKGLDESDQPLSVDTAAEYETQRKDLTLKLADVVEAFNNNAPLQNLIHLKAELESYALIELLTDIDFLKPIFKKILIGDVDKIDFTDASVIGFVRDVVTDFFTVMNRNSLKL